MNQAALNQAAADGLLFADQAKAIPGLIAGLESADRTRLDALLAAAPDDLQRIMLLKTLAAGAGVAEIEAFATQIRKIKDVQIRRVLNVPSIEVPIGDAKNVAIPQFAEGSCAESVVEFMHASRDPRYALWLHSNTDDLTDWNPDICREQSDYLRRSGAPTRGGTKMRWWLQFVNEVAAKTNGPYYELIDIPNSEEARRAAVADIVRVLDSGQLVPLYVYGGDGAHAVTAVRRHGDMIQIQSNDEVGWMSIKRMEEGRMDRWRINRLRHPFKINDGALEPVLGSYMRPTTAQPAQRVNWLRNWFARAL